jgi:CO dehydrogenase nickel-insertion accessory protein CooC1
VGKTALAAGLARELARRGRRTLAVDCDPNPNLAESFGLQSGTLDRFSFDDLLRVPGSLALAREPVLVEVEARRLWLLGGPPGDAPLNDAVARGIAGVLVAERFDAVVTDLGAGPELTRTAVGGVLNPADRCVVVTDGSPVAELAAERIEGACRQRGVPSLRWVHGVAPRDLVSALGD